MSEQASFEPMGEDAGSVTADARGLGRKAPETEAHFSRPEAHGSAPFEALAPLPSATTGLGNVALQQ